MLHNHQLYYNYQQNSAIGKWDRKWPSIHRISRNTVYESAQILRGTSEYVKSEAEGASVTLLSICVLTLSNIAVIQLLPLIQIP